MLEGAMSTITYDTGW